MHDPENPIENPEMFTSISNVNIIPQTVASRLDRAVVDESIRLRNETRDKTNNEVGFLEGFNAVLGKVATADRKQTPIGLDAQVVSFVKKYSAALGDISDEIAVRKIENSSEGKLDIEARVEHAVINQRFSQALYSAARSPEGDPQRRNVNVFYQTMSYLRDEGTGLGKAAMQELDAARAQSAAMLVFENAEYQVLVPDYNDEDEIRDMDVLAMADMVVVSPEGQVSFVDVKGRHFDSTNRRQEIIEYKDKYMDSRDPNINLRMEASKKLVRKLSTMGYPINRLEDVKRIELTIPTDPACLSPLGEVLKDELKIDILRSVRR